MASDQPSRFLDLPAELRCMVYECLNVETRLYTINYSYPFDTSTPVTASIVIKRLSTSILASCHLICAEAATTLASKLKHLRNHEPLHMMLVTVKAHPDSCFDSFITSILGSEYQEEWQRFRDIDEVEMRLCCDKIDVDTSLHTVVAEIAPEDFRTIGPWRTTIRGMDDAGRNEVCSSGEVIELM
jgi:hypothetical protein